MEQKEYPKSNMPIKAEKIPEELSSQQVADIIEAWDEVHKVRKEFIGEELWRKVTDGVNNLNLVRKFDPNGETDSFKDQLKLVALRGEELKKAEQRFEDVKEGKKFAPIIAEAVNQVYADRWLNFWEKLGFGGRGRTAQMFEDLGRFIEAKFGPPFAELGKEFKYYQGPGDLIFEIVTSDILKTISRIYMVRDRAGKVKWKVSQGKQPDYEFV